MCGALIASRGLKACALDPLTDAVFTLKEIRDTEGDDL
jgi:hypothetical protein